MKQYVVTVKDSITRNYFVDADNEEEARRLVEEDDDQFSYSIEDSYWGIEEIYEV